MRLGFTQSGTPSPFIASAFSPSTYARDKGVRNLSGVGALGLSTGTIQIASIAAQGAATTGAILTALQVSTMAGPIGAAVAGLIAVGIGIAQLFKGCGETCVAATQIANQLQTYWQQNLDHYMSAPVHYRSLQLAALNNFDTGWNAMYKACSDPSLGTAGQRCISERQRGGASPWCCNSPTSTQVSDGMCTGCDAFHDFRDPIANDPNVVPDPVDAASGTSAGGLFSGGTGPSSFPMPVLLIGGGILLAVSMMGD